MSKQTDSFEFILAKPESIPAHQFSPDLVDKVVEQIQKISPLGVRDFRAKFSEHLNAVAEGNIRLVRSSGGESVVLVSKHQFEKLMSEAKHSHTLAEAYAPTKYYPRLDDNITFEEKEDGELEQFKLP